MSKNIRPATATQMCTTHERDPYSAASGICEPAGRFLYHVPGPATSRTVKSCGARVFIAQERLYHYQYKYSFHFVVVYTLTSE